MEGGKRNEPSHRSELLGPAQPRLPLAEARRKTVLFSRGFGCVHVHVSPRSTCLARAGAGAHAGAHAGAGAAAGKAKHWPPRHAIRLNDNGGPTDRVCSAVSARTERNFFLLVAQSVMYCTVLYYVL